MTRRMSVGQFGGHFHQSAAAAQVSTKRGHNCSREEEEEEEQQAECKFLSGSCRSKTEPTARGQCGLGHTRRLSGRKLSEEQPFTRLAARAPPAEPLARRLLSSSSKGRSSRGKSSKGKSNLESKTMIEKPKEVALAARRTNWKTISGFWAASSVGKTICLLYWCSCCCVCLAGQTSSLLDALEPSWPAQRQALKAASTSASTSASASTSTSAQPTAEPKLLKQQQQQQQVDTGSSANGATATSGGFAGRPEVAGFQFEGGSNASSLAVSQLEAMLSSAVALAQGGGGGGAYGGSGNKSGNLMMNSNNNNNNYNENNSSNSSQSNSSSSNDEDESLVIGITIAHIIIFVIGFCGNSLVILVILKFTRIETVTDIYILNLAFADLMFLLGLVFLITTMLINYWIFGNLMCKVNVQLSSSSSGSSVWRQFLGVLLFFPLFRFPSFKLIQLIFNFKL